MIKPFLYLVFLVSFVSTAQNLVPNGSFEEYSLCPDSREANDGQFERCNGWWYPTDYNVGSPDYFNACNNSLSGLVGVPNNELGYQHAFHGNAYVGLGAFAYNIGSNEISGAEIIGTKLSQDLAPCSRYHFSMRINLANRGTHGISGIGIIISRDSLHMNTLAEWENAEPTWINSSPLIDSVNWEILEFDFIAEGGEQFLAIGYFGEYNYSELVFNDSSIINTYNFYFPYYYVDSVNLIEIGEPVNCTPELPNVFTPNGDLFNDEYSIEGLNISEMVILNRWGDVIITLSEDYPTWDGKFEGKLCLEGNYFYRATFGNIHFTGFIELIR